MSKKVYVDLKVRLKITHDDDMETGEVISGLEYEFSDTTGKATVEDSEMTDYDIIGVK